MKKHTLYWLVLLLLVSFGYCESINELNSTQVNSTNESTRESVNRIVYESPNAKIQKHVFCLLIIPSALVIAGLVLLKKR